MAFSEGAVLNRYIAPLIGSFLREEEGLKDELARQALLSESWKAIPALASWADSYLAAFATTSQFTLVTFDRALRTKAKPLVLLNP